MLIFYGFRLQLQHLVRLAGENVLTSTIYEMDGRHSETVLPRIHRLLFVSPHTGYLGDYARGSRWKMLLLWHVAMPVITQAIGFFPGRALGLPEDLPAGVALAWARRRFRWSIASDASYATCSHIATQGLCVRPSDDVFATEAAFKRVQARFDAAKFIDSVLEVTHPKEHLGHFGFFRSASEEHWWPIALEWLAYGRTPKLAS